MVGGKLVFPNAREPGLGEKCQQFVRPEVRTVGERGFFPIWDVFYKAKVCFLRGGIAVGLKRAPVPGEVIIDEVSNAVSAVELPIYSFIEAWPANGVVCKVVLVLNESKGKAAATVLTENVVFPGGTSESKIKRRKSPCPVLPQGVQMGLNQERGWVADQDSGECGLLQEGWGSVVQGRGVLQLGGDDLCRVGWGGSRSRQGRAEVMGVVWSDVPQQPPEGA